MCVFDNTVVSESHRRVERNVGDALPNASNIVFNIIKGVLDTKRHYFGNTWFSSNIIHPVKIA